MWGFRFAVDKSFRVVEKRLVEHVLSCGLQLLCQPVVHGIGREEPQAAVAVLGVVPGKEAWNVGTRFLHIGEASGVCRRVFECFELAFGIGVVVRYARSAVAGQDVQIDHQLRKRLRFHRGAAILVQRHLFGLNALLRGGVGNQALGQRGALPSGDHPGHDKAREEIRHHVEGIDHPFSGSRQPGDVPRPHLVRRTGHQPGGSSRG